MPSPRRRWRPRERLSEATARATVLYSRAATSKSQLHDSFGRCRRTDSFRSLLLARAMVVAQRELSNDRERERKREDRASDDDVGHRRRGYVPRFVSFRFCRLATVNRLKAYLAGMYLTPRPRSIAINSMLSFPFFASHSLSNAPCHPVCPTGSPILTD